MLEQEHDPELSKLGRGERCFWTTYLEVAADLLQGSTAYILQLKPTGDELTEPSHTAFLFFINTGRKMM